MEVGLQWGHDCGHVRVCVCVRVCMCVCVFCVCRCSAHLSLLVLAFGHDEAISAHLQRLDVDAVETTPRRVDRNFADSKVNKIGKVLLQLCIVHVRENSFISFHFFLRVRSI